MTLTVVYGGVVFADVDVGGGGWGWGGVEENAQVGTGKGVTDIERV